MSDGQGDEESGDTLVFVDLLTADVLCFDCLSEIVEEPGDHISGRAPDSYNCESCGK